MPRPSSEPDIGGQLALNDAGGPKLGAKIGTCPEKRPRISGGNIDLARVNLLR